MGPWDVSKFRTNGRSGFSTGLRACFWRLGSGVISYAFLSCSWLSSFGSLFCGFDVVSIRPFAVRNQEIRQEFRSWENYTFLTHATWGGGVVWQFLNGHFHPRHEFYKRKTSNLMHHVPGLLWAAHGFTGFPRAGPRVSFLTLRNGRRLGAAETLLS